MSLRIKRCNDSFLKDHLTATDIFLCRILDDLDQRVEGTYDKLKRGSKRLQRFILANEGEQVLCHVLSDLCQSPNLITV